jgi:endonuclease III
LQLKYRDQPWKLLAVCLLLKRTTQAQVGGMIEDLFLDYPTPEALSDAREAELCSLLHPLSMARTRARRLIAFADDWLALSFMWEGTTPNGLTELSALTGMNKYALDSYRMFVLDDLSVQPDDAKLRTWLRWRESCDTPGKWGVRRKNHITEN